MGGAARVLDVSAADEELATDVAEGELDLACGGLEEGGAGELAGGLAFDGEGGARRGGIAGEGEAAEGAVDLAPGADALDDLLAEVAAFAEVQGAVGAGLLREIAVADVGTEEGCAFEDAEVIEGGGGAGGSAEGMEFRGESGEGGFGGPELEAGGEGAVGADDGEWIVVPDKIGEAGGGALWREKAEAGEETWGMGACEEEAFAFGSDVGKLDIVHDDEAVE